MVNDDVGSWILGRLDVELKVGCLLKVMSSKVR